VRDYSLLKKGLLVLAVLHAAAQLLFWLPIQWKWTASSDDTAAYYHAASALWRRGTLYPAGRPYNPAFPPHSYVYWPQFAVLLAPLGSLSRLWFARCWYTLLVAAFWTFSWSLARIAQGKATWQGVLLWGLALACLPSVYYCLWIGNADPVVWAIVGLAFATGRTAEWLAVAAQIKTYAVAALGLFLWDHRAGWKRPLAILAAGFAAAFAADPAWPGEWLRTVAPAARQGTLWAANWSLPMALVRACRALGWRYHGGTFPVWVQTLLAISCLVFEVSAVAFCARLRGQYRYAALFVLAALSQPLCWNFYLTSALVLVALALRDYGVRSGLPATAPELPSSGAPPAIPT
jgi:hypothetical protein